MKTAASRAARVEVYRTSARCPARCLASVAACQYTQLRLGCLFALHPVVFAHCARIEPRTSVVAVMQKIYASSFSRIASLVVAVAFASAAPAQALSATAASSAAHASTAILQADDAAVLNVSASTNGKVFIDDKEVGETPLVAHSLKAGRHTIKVVAKDGSEKSMIFEAKAGEDVNLHLNLEKSSKPKADATTDGKTDGKTDAKADGKTDGGDGKTDGKTGGADGKTDGKTDGAADGKAADGATDGKTADGKELPKPAPTQDWTWMTVAGWGGLGLGTIGVLAGSVVLSTPTDPNRDPLGFGLFGTGAGLLLGGGVMLYLDNEMMAAKATEGTTPAPAGEGNAQTAQ